MSKTHADKLAARRMAERPALKPRPKGVKPASWKVPVNPQKGKG